MITVARGGKTGLRLRYYSPFVHRAEADQQISIYQGSFVVPWPLAFVSPLSLLHVLQAASCMLCNTQHAYRMGKLCQLCSSASMVCDQRNGMALIAAMLI